ncbi:MAG: hypothetical protein HQL26_06505 [Candidatus Omnitrophica bacterium]|nr:hypothetical protein [Candidatus Omnitrophota bacterium]
MNKKLAVGLVGLALVFCGLARADEAGFVASKKSTVYHLPACVMVKQITPDNKVTFNTPEEAIKAGYKPCQKCNPPQVSKKDPAFVGSKNSTVYHLLSCKLAQNITADNKVAFAGKDEAEKAGYKPCKICLLAADKTAVETTTDKSVSPKADGKIKADKK